MAYKVQIAAAAEGDMADAVAFINNDSPLQARQWLQGLATAVRTLAELPYRFAIIPEADELGQSLRSMPYHSHRVIYEVDEIGQMVSVVRIYHAARAPLRLDEFKD